MTESKKKGKRGKELHWGGNGIVSPCYGCTERHATCHAECKKYQEYSEECSRIRAKRIKINELYGPRDNGKAQLIRKRLLDRSRRGGR